MLFNKFLKLNSDSNFNKDLHISKDLLLYKIGYLSARIDKLSSLSIFYKVFKNNYKLTLPYILKYFFMVIFGKLYVKITHGKIICIQ